VFESDLGRLDEVLARWTARVSGAITRPVAATV
jgi:hypothetical protein